MARSAADPLTATVDSSPTIKLKSARWTRQVIAIAIVVILLVIATWLATATPTRVILSTCSGVPIPSWTFPPYCLH